jgi:hypothetical protein
MTLEQIKNRQERINETLYFLLADVSVTVEKVVGDLPAKEQAISEPNYQGSGLLFEITNSQNLTEDYISRLFDYQRLLSNGVYSPVEARDEVKNCK